jgi:hypothetical protein
LDRKPCEIARPGVVQTPASGSKQKRVGRAGRRQWLEIGEEVTGFTYRPGELARKVKVAAGTYRVRVMPSPVSKDTTAFRMVGQNGAFVFIAKLYLDKEEIDYELTAVNPTAKAA